MAESVVHPRYSWENSHVFKPLNVDHEPVRRYDPAPEAGVVLSHAWLMLDAMSAVCQQDQPGSEGRSSVGPPWIANCLFVGAM